MVTRALLLSLAIFIISFIANEAFAGLIPENFTHTAEIQGDTAKGSLYRAHLTGDILQSCIRNCGDIRLFDADNREVPYVILETKIDHERESYEVELLEFQENQGGAVLTLKMPDKSDQINNLKIDTPNRDFRIDIIIYGSNDQNSWSSIVSDVIYDFSSQVDIRKTEIRIPPLCFKYLMLKMSYGATKGTGDQINLKYNGLDFSVSNPQFKNIRINRVLAEALVEDDTESVYDEMPVPDYSMERGKKNETMIIVNTGIPLQRIYLDVSNPYYFRKVTVFWDEKGEIYSLEVGNGAIYRFPIGRKQEAKNYIDLTSRRKGFYKVVIENDGNPPPDIKGVRLGWIQKQLFFVAMRDSGKYILSIGSDAADAKNYDLIQFVNDKNWNKLSSQSLSISSVVRSAGYRPAVRDDKKAAVEKMILVMIVMLLVAGMGFWLYMLLRKTAEKGSG